jgi:PTS system glucitol/sorbitol-specific IIA component
MFIIEDLSGSGATPGDVKEVQVPDRPTDVGEGRSARVVHERYVTEVTAVGPLFADFRDQGLVILFGETAPAELHEFVVRHRPTLADSAPRPGDVLELAGHSFTVTAVGDAVPENLLRLGHASVKAHGNTSPPLPGDICVRAGPLPDLEPGSIVRILGSG